MSTDGVGPLRLLLGPGIVALAVAAPFLLSDATESAPRVEEAELVDPAAFCAAFDELAAAHDAFLRGKVSTTLRVKEAAALVGELGQATAMPEGARAGLVFVVSSLVGLADDAPPQALVEVDDASTTRESIDAESLGYWLDRVCRRTGLSQAK